MDNSKKKLVMLGLLLLGCLITSLVNTTDNFSYTSPRKDEKILKEPGAAVKEVKSKAKSQPTQLLLVEVKGAVRKPGKYLLPQESRVEEAVAMAGGLLEEANINKLNTTKKLKDGVLIYVPFEKAAKLKSGRSEKNSTVAAGPISINQASQQELETLPGIGPAMAQRIIAHRQAKRFLKIEELLEIRGIGQAKLEKLKPLISL